MCELIQERVKPTNVGLHVEIVQQSHTLFHTSMPLLKDEAV